MNILYYRKKHHMTQKELASAVGITQAYVHALESGKRINPSTHVLMKIAHTLDVSIEKLLAEQQEAV